MDSATRKAQIEKSKAELDPVLNFLREDEYLNPETPILKKEGRENFFKDFHEESVVYHVVENWDKHELKCYMLIPKSLDTSHRVLFHVLFHGGGLTTGGGNYVHWFADYKRDLAIDANAITLIPMYRLMPEDRGAEIQQDVDDWWTFYRGNKNEECKRWIDSCLSKHGMDKGIEKLDRTGLLISGESAGALLAVYSWLTQPQNLRIRVLYLQYPMLRYYAKEIPKDQQVVYMNKSIPAKEVQSQALKLLETVNKQRKEDRAVSRSDSRPPIGMAAAMLLSNTQQWESVFKDGKGAMDAPTLLKHHLSIKKLPGSFPEMFIIHGKQDTACPIQNTQDFVESLKTAFVEWGQGIKMHYEEIESAGHAFDYEVKKDEALEKTIGGMMVRLIQAWSSQSDE